MIIIFFSFFTFSDVSLLFNAKASKQIEEFHKKEFHRQVLHQRCEIELRQKWIPRTCFLWLQQTKLSSSDKDKMEDFFNVRCVEAISQLKNQVFPEGFLKNLKKGPCYVAAQQYYLDRHYQLQKQAPLQVMEEHLKVGREIESILTHGSEKDYKN
ncbi:hypothetical protein K2X05_01205 [bacterium]|nr:hypothetical protein [bacterium]